MLRIISSLLASCVSGECLVENTTTVVCPSQEYQTIPDRFPRSIRTLALPGSNISELPKHSFLKYNHLVELNLDYNKFRSTQYMAGVSSLRHLRVISIVGNDLQVLDFYDFSMNVRLEEFYADNNGHVQINDKRVNLPKLRNVSLNYNNLESLPLEAFKGFPKLEVLSLKYNKLETLPDLHTVLKNLKEILLEGNPIKHLNPELELKSDLLGEVTSIIPLDSDVSPDHTRIDESNVKTPNITSETPVHVENTLISKSTKSNFTVDEGDAKSGNIEVDGKAPTNDGLYISIIVVLVIIIVVLVVAIAVLGFFLIRLMCRKQPNGYGLISNA